MNATDFTALLDTYYDTCEEFFDWDMYLKSEVFLNCPRYNKNDKDLPYFVMANKRETIAVLIMVIEKEGGIDNYPFQYLYYVAACTEDGDAYDLLDRAEECGIPIEKTGYSTMLARMLHGIDGGSQWVVPELIYAVEDWYLNIRFEGQY